MDKRRSIMRNRRKNQFVVIANAVARNKELTHAAKGLLLQMLSYPDDWEFSLKHLAGNSSSGLHATRSAFKELQERGYVTRELKRNDAGHLIGYDYSVYDEPTVVRFSDVGKPHATNTDLTNIKNYLGYLG